MLWEFIFSIGFLTMWLWLCTFVVLTYGLYMITAMWLHTFRLNHSSCNGNETLSRNKIRIWPSEIIKMLKQIWTEVIVIMGIKLLFWLLMASKNPCGITCNCWTKNELKTELDYFVKQYALGHFNSPCSGQTTGYCWQNNLIMIILIVKNGRSIQINCLMHIRTITDLHGRLLWI